MKTAKKETQDTTLDFEQPLRGLDQQIAELESKAETSETNNEAAKAMTEQIETLTAQRNEQVKKLYAELTPWQTVQVARHPERPVFQDYIARICTEFIELHGDRFFADDHAIVGGFATIDTQRVMLIGMEKGKTIEEKVHYNFGMANPEGYRKALRLMKLAEKYSLPVVCIVDTPAAYPGMEAEERGQAEAIARNLAEMSSLEVPIVVVITGEGGSGGALGLAIGDVVLMLSHAIYSVIPPEGCAAILWRDAAYAAQAAEALKITAPELLELGVIDEIIPEPDGGAHRDADAIAEAVKTAIQRHLVRLKKLSKKRMIERRYDKYVAIGKFDTRKYATH